VVKSFCFDGAAAVAVNCVWTATATASVTSAVSGGGDLYTPYLLKP